MLDQLKFAQGGIARKDIVPVLKHYRIVDGRVTAYNGVLALCAPVDLDLDVSPQAGKFHKALEACEGTVTLYETPAGRLAVCSEDFKVFVDCTTDDFPDIEPQGEEVAVGGELLPALKSIARFISDDASRPWSRGVLLVGGSAYATNNIILVERWLGFTMPRPINLPVQCVDELLRIGEEPTHYQVSDTSITFHYEGDRWLRSQLLDLSWPNVQVIVDCEHSAQPISDDLFAVCDKLKPFTNKQGQLFFSEHCVATEKVSDTGAYQTIDCAEANGIYNVNQFLRLRGIVTDFDWSRYPKPCAFFGDQLRGVIIGMKDVL